MEERTRAALIGCGGMARHHLRTMLGQDSETVIPVVAEPSGTAYELAAEMFVEAGLQPPDNQPDLDVLLDTYDLDAAFIISPHVYHHVQALKCLNAGLDVLLEKPMVMNAQEAESLIAVQENTGRLLVVAFNGSLSPQVRTAVELLRSGQLGNILSVSATVWQGWAELTIDSWRQDPAISGGGFLFDTGAHMLNTVTDLLGEPFSEVAAWLDNNGRSVETEAAVIGRLASGTLVSLHANGETIPGMGSEVLVVGSEGLLRTGVWGERLELQRRGDDMLQPVDVPPSQGVWEQFLRVRRGEIPNPCPPDVGLRMARLYDAIVESASLGGKIVQLD